MSFKRMLALMALSTITFVSNAKVINAEYLTTNNYTTQLETFEQFNQNSNGTYDDIISELKKMTDEELNDYIDYLMNQNVDSSNSTSFSQRKQLRLLASAPSSVGTAWLTAAEILSRNGYECTGKLITFSVKGVDYKETHPFDSNGLFSSKIVKTSVFKSYFSKMKKSAKLPKGLEFTKNDNKDLYLSLHNTDISSETRLPNSALATYHFRITDTYDFKKSNYEDVMVGLVNNFAWLCQNTNVLHNINVEIYFVKSE